MRIIRAFFLGVFVMLGLYLLIGLFLPSHARIERSIVIDRPALEVYRYVADFNNWLTWNPWTAMDPAATNVISEPGSGPGASWQWQGEQIGEGKLTRIAEEEPRRLESRLEFIAPMQNSARDIWEFRPVAGGTEVSWIYEQELRYPNERYLGLFLNNMLGDSYETGLKSLKSKMEN
jgi:hypothetical protein